LGAKTSSRELLVWRLAVALVGEGYALSGAWRHGVFRQAVAVRQWR